jgi:hypothetical protein
MANRQAFCNMLKIDPKLSNEVKDAIISAYHQGLKVGRKEGAEVARREIRDQMRAFLGFDKADDPVN